MEDGMARTAVDRMIDTLSNDPLSHEMTRAAGRRI
jgi:hypothetical protein